MRRHVIIGRFGPADDTQIPVRSDEFCTQIDLMAPERRLAHGIGGALEDLHAIGIFPSELGLDFAVLAALVHLADTRISRDTESQDTWTREVRLVVPVSDPVRWTSAEALLQRMLNFLTGDRWLIGFRPRPTGFSSILPARPEHVTRPPFGSLSLFSGGLDSLIGAIDTLEAGGVPLLVSHASEGATSDAQTTCFNALKEHYMRLPFARLRVWMSFAEGVVKGVASESTTRGRSFLFLALGIFAGTGLDAPFTLHVPENGLIALNVPLDVLRLSSLSTRTTHPFYMARWNELLGQLGVDGCIKNPYWSDTKGEMVSACANQAMLKQLVGSSLSCSSPSKGRWEGRGIEHCGYCLPCIIRRAALQAAWGLGQDPTVYTIQDLGAQPLDTCQAEGKQVRSFQVAIARLGANPGLEKILIHKPGPLTDESLHLESLADVYRRGMEEVGALLAGVNATPS